MFFLSIHTISLSVLWFLHEVELITRRTDLSPRTIQQREQLVYRSVESVDFPLVF